MTFRFWQNWLTASCFLFGIVGVCIATFPEAPVFALWHEGFRNVFAGGENLTVETEHAKRFLLGPLGGTILGSYILCGFIAAGPFGRREPWAWWAITTSLLAWFVLDSTVSILHGAYFNVYLINGVTLVVQGIPLAMTARAFRDRPIDA